MLFLTASWAPEWDETKKSDNAALDAFGRDRPLGRLTPGGSSLSFVACPAIEHGFCGRARLDRDQPPGFARLSVWAAATSTSELRSVS